MTFILRFVYASLALSTNRRESLTVLADLIDCLDDPTAADVDRVRQTARHGLVPVQAVRVAEALAHLHRTVEALRVENARLAVQLEAACDDYAIAESDRADLRDALEVARGEGASLRALLNAYGHDVACAACVARAEGAAS